MTAAGSHIRVAAQMEFLFMVTAKLNKMCAQV
jgi:hypothetical protein